VNQALKWWAAGLTVAGTFGLATWVSGAFLLPLWMKSGADRWVVAAGLGVAVSALAALWGHSWAMRESAAEPDTASPGERSITAANDVRGIASTGDDATNVQLK
jgi:hypothetical protein